MHETGWLGGGGESRDARGRSLILSVSTTDFSTQHLHLFAFSPRSRKIENRLLWHTISRYHSVSEYARRVTASRNRTQDVRSSHHSAYCLLCLQITTIIKNHKKIVYKKMLHNSWNYLVIARKPKQKLMPTVFSTIMVYTIPRCKTGRLVYVQTL